MLRRIASRLHLWIGIGAGLFLIVAGLTGSVLVFEDAIDAALNPELHHVEPQEERASLQVLAEGVREAFPGRSITRVEFPQAPDEAMHVLLDGDGREVFVDAYTGTVLGSRLPAESLTGFIFELHVHLLAGEWGKTAVGVLGLLLLVLSLTGLVLWWRGRRQVRRGLTVEWSGSTKRVNYDLHNTVGFYTLLPLLVVAFTGAGLVFYSAFTDAAHRLTSTPSPPPPPQSTCCADDSPPALDALVERAQDAFPEARLSRLDFPADAQAAYRVRLQLPEEMHPVGMTMVFLDQYSGEVLRAESATEAPGARRFGYWFYPLHIGSFGGLGVKALYLIIGLAPAALAVTGLLIWYFRSRKRQRSRREQQVPRRARPITESLPEALTQHKKTPHESQ